MATGIAREGNEAPPAAALSPAEEWLDRHGDYLFRYALARTRDPHLAEDLVQETLLAALQARQGFAGQSSEATWLTGILRHKLFDLFRRRSRETLRDDVEAAADVGETLFREDGHWKRQPARSPDPLERVEDEDFWRVLSGCLGRMPTRLADAFALREMEGLGTEEVCKVLGVTPTNLWVMLHRARLRLRECLQDRWIDGREGRSEP